MALFTSAALGAGLISLGSGFLATVSAIALNAAVGIGLQMAVSALQKKPGEPEPLGVRGKMQSGGDVARSIILGRRATAGSLVYANTWGQAGKTPNAYFTQVIALSDMPVSAMTAMWVNGEPVTIDTSDTSLANERGYPVEEYRADEGDWLWVKFYDGTQTVADPFLVASVGSVDRPYEATRVGRGVAYAIVTARSNGELFSGFPSFRFEVQGMPLYDITKDSTSGGDGPQRWNDPATWGGDGDNLPVVQVYNILRGITYNSDWIYGLQSTPAARFPATDWITQINKCRLLVQGADGMEPQYTTGAEIALATEIATSIEALLRGCHGRPIETGGIYKVRVGEAGAAVFAFTDDDILSTEPQTGKPILGLADSVNGVTASYPEPEESWNTKAAPPLYSPNFEERDGNRRLISNLDLSTVSVARQVQQIMKAALDEARRERRHTLVLPPSFWTVEPGDVGAWSSPRNGYAAKLFRVDGVADRANLDVMVDVTEVDPADYNFDFFTDYTPPDFTVIVPDRPPPQPMYGWTAVPAVIYDASGNARRPSIKIGCAPDQDDVRNVWVQVRLKLSGVVVFDSDSTAYASPYEWVLNGVFLPTTTYQARGKFVPYSQRVTEWSDWIDVTTGDIKLLPGLDFDPYTGVVGLDNLAGDLKEYQDWLGAGRREILELLEQIDLLVADQDLGNALVHQQIREQLTATRDNITAEYMRQVDVLVTADQALALSVEQLKASIFDPATGLSAVASAVSALSTQVQTIDGELTATSDAVQDLEATVGNFSASGRFRTTVEATPAGAQARIGLSVSATAGGATSTAAMYLDALAGGLSRIVFEASQFIVVAGGNLNNPFVVDGTAVRMNVANIGTVNAGLIQSPNGKMVINVTAGTIVVNS
jgi:hypothetical protein